MATPKKKAEKELSPNQIKHLEFVQGNVIRFNSNSFQMRSWMLVVVTALLGSFANTGNQNFIVLALLPTIIFWVLDSYYLQLERKFRGIYNDVAGLSKEPKEVKPFAMPINQYTEDKYSFWDVFLSPTILPLYLLIIVVLLAIYFFM